MRSNFKRVLSRKSASVIHLVRTSDTQVQSIERPRKLPGSLLLSCSTASYIAWLAHSFGIRNSIIAIHDLITRHL
jgi:hypothetical protein